MNDLVSAVWLTEAITQVFTAAGLSPDAARTVAAGLVEVSGFVKKEYLIEINAIAAVAS